MRTLSWLAMLVVASQLFASLTVAQESGTPVVPANEATATEPAPTPTEPPAEPTAEPTEPAPTATAVPTTPTSEPDPPPTATPASALSYALAPAPDCRLADDQPGELASGGVIDYRCVSRLALSGEAIAPAGITMRWEIDAVITPGWSVQLRPPARTPDDAPAWTDVIDGTTRFSVDQIDAAGSSTAVGSLSIDIELVYHLRISRPACLSGAPVAELRHHASVSTPGTTAIDQNAGMASEPLRIAPALAALPPVAIAFDGPLDFGTIEATALGLSETRIEGRLSLTASGLDRACGTWNLWLESTPIVDADGAIREGFALLIGECDLTGGCLAATFVAGPDAPATHTITLIITLQTPQYAALGALGTTIDATVIASADGL